MSQAGRSVREIAARVVLWGPRGSGKTTTLRAVADRLDPSTRGPLLSPSDATDRTLFMDFLAVELGALDGVPLRVHLVALPGADRLSSTHRSMLKGADGFVFVADSSLARQNDNRSALESLRRHLVATGQDHLPLVVQLNRRDAADAVPVESMRAHLAAGSDEGDVYETVATEGAGVIEMLTGVSARVVARLSAAAEESSTP